MDERFSIIRKQRRGARDEPEQLRGGIRSLGVATHAAALGSPKLPDVPLAERLAKAVENNDFVAMVAQLEAHLAENPRDPEGWHVLANAYRM